MFGGLEGEDCIRQLELDAQNSVVMIRNVFQVGSAPSPRACHGAVMIGSSLMVICAGQDHDGSKYQQYSDSDMYVFNFSELGKVFPEV